MIHGGILVRNIPSDEAYLVAQKIQKVDYVWNLYPFKEAIAKEGITITEAAEEIDIGGVTLLRAAAKNHDRQTFLIELKRMVVYPKIRVDYSRWRLSITLLWWCDFRQQYSKVISQLTLRYGANAH